MWRKTGAGPRMPSVMRETRAYISTPLGPAASRKPEGRYAAAPSLEVRNRGAYPRPACQTTPNKTQILSSFEMTGATQLSTKISLVTKFEF